MRRNRRGTVLIMVILLALLMVMVAVLSVNMLYQDVHMARHLVRSTQALYLADAGIADAVATLKNLGYDAKNDPNNFPSKNVDGTYGSYDVDVIPGPDSRVILSSTGTVDGISRTVKMEISDNTPTSLYMMMSAGNNVHVQAHAVWVTSVINGDLRANNTLTLYAKNKTSISINSCGAACCDGSISHSSTEAITITQQGSGTVTYAGSKTTGAPPVTFPTFDYTYYMGLAQAGNGGADYYDPAGGTQYFNNVTLTPENGIIYVNGDVEFDGTSTLYGGIVANNITIRGTFNQYKTALNRNVIVSKVGDINIRGAFNVEEGVVFATNDFAVREDVPIISITGTLIAGHDLDVWDKKCVINYNHKLLYPDGLTFMGGTVGSLRIVSWNR